jgi:hypothetical protein
LTCVQLCIHFVNDFLQLVTSGSPSSTFGSSVLNLLTTPTPSNHRGLGGAKIARAIAAMLDSAKGLASSSNVFAG